MSAPSPHLELEELLADGCGEAISHRAWMHLAACQECQAEAVRWESVVAGVRHLAAAIPVPPLLAGSAPARTRAARASSLPHPRRRRSARTGRRPRRTLAAAAAAAAAAVLAAGGTSYGLRAGSGDASGGPAAAAGLIAVSGCSGIAAGLGTVERVNGASLVLRTPGGQRLTVTTSEASVVSREVTGSVSDIRGGQRVFLRGIYARGRITAFSISIGVARDLPAHRIGRLTRARARPWIGAGTVRDAVGGSFILVTPGGARVPVTASDSAAVFTLAGAGLSQARAGEYVVAVGKAGPGGTLQAATVEEGASLPHDRSNGISRFPGIGCRPSTIAAAALISVN
jgi:hypothetical protein